MLYDWGASTVSKFHPIRVRDTTLHIGFSSEDMEHLRYYAAGCQVTISTLIRGIVHARLDQAQRSGWFHLEIPDVEMPAYGR